MKTESSRKGTAEEMSYVPKISRTLYIQVEETLNLRKAVSSRKNMKTLKQIARSQWMGQQK